MGNAAASSPRIYNNTDKIVKIVCWDTNGRETSQVVREKEYCQMTIPSGKMTISAFILAGSSPVDSEGNEAILSTENSCYDFTIQIVDGLLNITQAYSMNARERPSSPRIRNSTNESLRVIVMDKDGRQSSQIVTSQKTWHPNVPPGTLTVSASHLQSDKDKVEKAIYTANSYDNFTIKLVEGFLNIELE